MTIESCKNHPQITAVKRCYHCKQLICMQCQILVNDHFFCSLECHYKTRRSVSRIFKPLHILLTFQKSSPQVKKRARRRLVRWTYKQLQLLLIFSFIAATPFLLFKNCHLQNRLETLESSLYGSDFRTRSVPQMVGSHNQLAFADAMVTANEMTIHGEAPEGHIISIKRDNWVCAVTLPQNGRFALPPIQLKPGQNRFIVEAMGPNGKYEILEKIKFDYGVPTVNHQARNFIRGNRNRRQVALTFDGGSLANIATPILNILAKHDIQITMFLTGLFIKRYPDIVKRIIDEGHEVGNHTWNHPHLTTFAKNFDQTTKINVTRLFLQDQLQRTAQLFYEITGQKMTNLWRAPFGEHNAEIRRWAAEIGYQHIGWTHGKVWEESMDTLDWVADTTSHAYHTTDEILKNILNIADRGSYGANGGIVLMHLGSSRQNDPIYKMLSSLIIGFQQRNYQITKVSVLML